MAQLKPPLHQKKKGPFNHLEHPRWLCAVDDPLLHAVARCKPWKLFLVHSSWTMKSEHELLSSCNAIF